MDQDKMTKEIEEICEAMSGSIYKNETKWSIETLPQQSEGDALTQEILQKAKNDGISHKVVLVAKGFTGRLTNVGLYCVELAKNYVAAQWSSGITTGELVDDPNTHTFREHIGIKAAPYISESEKKKPIQKVEEHLRSYEGRRFSDTDSATAAKDVVRKFTEHFRDVVESSDENEMALDVDVDDIADQENTVVILLEGNQIHVATKKEYEYPLQIELSCELPPEEKRQ